MNNRHRAVRCRFVSGLILLIQTPVSIATSNRSDSLGSFCYKGGKFLEYKLNSRMPLMLAHLLMLITDLFFATYLHSVFKDVERSEEINEPGSTE